MSYEAVPRSRATSVAAECHVHLYHQGRIVCGATEGFATTDPRQMTCPTCASAPAVPVPEISEAALQEAIRLLARQGGWLYYHTYASKRSPSGFPDVVLAPPRDAPPHVPVLMLELKSAAGVVTAAQADWLARLEGRAMVARVVRGDDVADLAAQLSQGRRRDVKSQP